MHSAPSEEITEEKRSSASLPSITDFLPKPCHSSGSVGLRIQSLCGFSGTPMASCRPMFPTVTPPEKKMQGSQERM